MLKFSPPLTPKFSKFTLPLHCARQFRRRPIQSFKQSNNHSFKQSSIQAIPHPPLCATIPSSPHPNNHPFKQSPIQTIKHSNNQTIKQSFIQTIKHSSNPPPSTVRDDSIVAPSKQSPIQAITHSNNQALKQSNNQTFKHSNIQAFKHSSNQAIPHPPLCATIPSSPPLARRANNILSVKIIFVSLQIENSTNYGEQSTE